jgi:hypothetical protein
MTASFETNYLSNHLKIYLLKNILYNPSYRIIAKLFMDEPIDFCTDKK